MTSPDHNTRKAQGLPAKPGDPLDSVVVPHISGAGRISALLRSGTPENYQRVQELLKETECSRLIELVAEYVGMSLTPAAVPLACDVFNKGVFAATSTFLLNCAAVEYANFGAGRGPLLQGDAYAPLRQLIARFAVLPQDALTEKQWDGHQGIIEGSVLFPLTILRRCAGREIDALVAGALTRGGICSYMNSRALQLLSFREQSSSTRVLSENVVLDLVNIHGDMLRDYDSQHLITSIVDLWLGKSGGPEKQKHDRQLVSVLAGRLKEQIFRGERLEDYCVHNIVQTVRLLRHFKADPRVRRLLEDTSTHPHAGISSYAQLTLKNSAPEAVAHLTGRLLESADARERSQALSAFSQPLPHIAESLILPYFKEYVGSLYGGLLAHPKETREYAMEWNALQDVVVGRFLSEPFSSRFMQLLFNSADQGKEPHLGELARATLARVAATNRIPPLSFYDNPSTIEVAKRIVQELDSGLPPGKGSGISLDGEVAPAESVRSLFLETAPLEYGFKIESLETR